MFSKKLSNWGERIFGPTPGPEGGKENESSRGQKRISFFVYSDTGFFMARNQQLQKRPVKGKVMAVAGESAI